MTWWFCTDQENAEKYVWINTDRWFDARRTAWQLLGSEKLWITHSKTERTRPPKQAYKDKAVYQGVWHGSAGHAIDSLRFEVSRVLVKKLRCTHCDVLLWPWQVEDLGSHLGHLVIYARGPGDPPGNGYCGPVGPRVPVVVEKSATSLPDAVPYEDEIPPSLAPPAEASPVEPPLAETPP